MQDQGDDNMSEDEENVVLKAQDDTAAGSNAAFLKSNLVFKSDEHGQEVCLVKAGDEEVGVMMGWETEISSFVRPRLTATCADGWFAVPQCEKQSANCATIMMNLKRGCVFSTSDMGSELCGSAGLLVAEQY